MLKLPWRGLPRLQRRDVKGAAGPDPQSAGDVRGLSRGAVTERARREGDTLNPLIY